MLELSFPLLMHKRKDTLYIMSKINTEEIIMRKHLILFLLLVSTFAFAQKKILTLEQAYLRGKPQIIKQLPHIQYCETENSYLKTGKDKIVKITLPNKKEKTVIDFNNIADETFDLRKAVTHTPDYTKLILKTENDLFLYRKEESKIVQLTNDNAEEKNPAFLRTENLLHTQKTKICLVGFDKAEKKNQLTFGRLRLWV